MAFWRREFRDLHKRDDKLHDKFIFQCFYVHFLHFLSDDVSLSRAPSLLTMWNPKELFALNIFLLTQNFLSVWLKLSNSANPKNSSVGCFIGSFKLNSSARSQSGERKIVLCVLRRAERNATSEEKFALVKSTCRGKNFRPNRMKVFSRAEKKESRHRYLFSPPRLVIRLIGRASVA